ncbi:MAG TPA: DoxX family protein [Chitinophagaceae bacterium]|nr:DoxX family protein [Chitinophagaceae bacterium]
MNISSRIQQWSITHNPKWLIVLRVVLGLFLFQKGIVFIYRSEELKLLLEYNAINTGTKILAWYIMIAHLLGGISIIAGLFTRFMCLLQIPILLGAVFLINLKNGIYANNSELGFSILILLLLFIFLLEGGGPLSLDAHFRRPPKGG